LCASMAANAADWPTCVIRGGKASCPEYVTIVPSKATDGSVVVQPNVSTTLFGGITPPNGFIVQVAFPTNGGSCFVNDNGPAASFSGFQLLPPVFFVTPLGYKPMGPVSIFCNNTAQVEARAW
jgi:hypothetical protein